MERKEIQGQKGCNLVQRAFDRVIGVALVVGPLAYAARRIERNVRVLREARAKTKRPSLPARS